MRPPSWCKNNRSLPLLAFVAWFLQFAAAVGFGLLAQSAAAQNADFPNRSVRIVLPLPPGSSNDAVLRMIAERLSRQWQVPVIVENKVGAGTIIGTDAVAKAPADGYTLLATISLIAQNHTLQKKLPYDTLRDLVPVTQFNRQQLSIYVNGNSPIRSASELISSAEANPGKVNFASWGIGSTAHLAMEKFRVDKGAHMTHIPYRGGIDIINAVLSGNVDVGAGDLRDPAPFLQSGQLRIIAVTGPSRVPALPDIGTLAEAGVTGFEGYNWLGLFAPAGTPTEVVHKISAAINQVQSDPAFAKQLADKLQVMPSFTTPEEFAAIFQNEIARWESVIKATGVTIAQ